jgi:hypothetical protein
MRQSSQRYGAVISWIALTTRAGAIIGPNCHIPIGPRSVFAGSVAPSDGVNVDALPSAAPLAAFASLVDASHLPYSNGDSASRCFCAEPLTFGIILSACSHTDNNCFAAAALWASVNFTSTSGSASI